MSEGIMEDAPVTVTLKYGAGYDAPWAVFRGNSTTIARHIKEFRATSLDAITVNTAKLLGAEWKTSKPLDEGGLDATVVEEVTETPAVEAKEAPKPRAKRPATAKVTEDTPKVENVAPVAVQSVPGPVPGANETQESDLLVKIDSAATTDALKGLLRVHKATLNADKALQDAYKRRLLALKEEGK